MWCCGDEVLDARGCGILLHISSLSSAFGIGDFGPDAYRFVDFLVDSKQKYWQILPLGPTEVVKDNSPYSSCSAFAGNPIFISPEILVKDGILGHEVLRNIPKFSNTTVEYEKVTAYKNAVLDLAFENVQRISCMDEYERFCMEHAYWLDDFAIFMVLKALHMGKPWYKWPKHYRLRDKALLQDLIKRKASRIERERFIQFLFFRQWSLLKRECNSRGIQIIGDLPIYVDYDSVDVWAHPELFKLGSNMRPLFVSGVPPDYFSRTGQLWGNPVYNWPAHKTEGYRWWLMRLNHALKMYDYLRIDHFRGFVAYWEVKAGARTARNGKWVPGPGKDLFDTLLRHINPLPIVAEDLGVITDDVRDLMAAYNFPGMRVLQFAFGKDFKTSVHAPHNHEKNCIVYTGTHDNNTTRGWYMHEASSATKRRLRRYLGAEVNERNVHQYFIRLAMMSVAKIAVIPMQDVLGLGAESRMNTPATAHGNWRWRMRGDDLKGTVANNLGEWVEIYGRI